MKCIWPRKVKSNTQLYLGLPKKLFKSWLWNPFHWTLMVEFATGSSPCVLLRFMLPGWPWRRFFLPPLIVFIALQGPAQGFLDFLFKINCSHNLLLQLYVAPCTVLCSMCTCLRTCLLLKIENLRPGTKSESSLCFFSVSSSILNLEMLNKYFNWIYYSE